MGVQISSIFGSSTTITATGLASLANGSALALAGQSNISSSEGAQLIRVYYSIMTGTSPTNLNTFSFYLLQGDASSPNLYTDGAPTAGGSVTLVTAKPIEVVQVTATSNQAYVGSFVIRNPGPYWGIAVLNNTGVALNATGTNFSIRYVTESVST